MNYKRLLWMLCTLLVMALIFSFSADTGDSSGSKSGFFVDLLYPLAAFLFTSEQLSFLIRKTAHFSIYFALGFCMVQTLYHFGLSVRKRIGLALLFCFLYACSDELHQLLVPGRAAQLRDVLIDSSGAMTAILLREGFALWLLRYKRSKES